MNEAILKKYSIDYEEGLARFFNDEDLYGSILTAFLGDDTFDRVKAAYESGDLDALFKCVHEFKSVAGNSSLTGLYSEVCALLDYFRGGGTEAGKIDSLFFAMDIAYSQAREGIQLALAE